MVTKKVSKTSTDIVGIKGVDLKNKFLSTEVLRILTFMKLFQHLRF